MTKSCVIIFGVTLIMQLVHLSKSIPEIIHIKPTNWEKPAWERFQIEHLLDPKDPSNANYKHWDRVTWAKWLKRREFKHQVATHFQATLLSKRDFVSMIIATPTELINGFKNAEKDSSIKGLYWSNRPFDVLLFLRKEKQGSILLCHNLYFTAYMESDRPVFISRLTRYKDSKHNSFPCDILHRYDVLPLP